MRIGRPPSSAARSRCIAVFCGVVAGASSAAAALTGFGQEPTPAQIAGAGVASLLSGVAAWLSRIDLYKTKKTGAQFAMS